MLWAGFKSLFTVTAILCVMLALGISHSPKLLAAWMVLLGVGITFSCIALIFNALAKGYDFFTYYFTLFLTPMMFLSGVFFPREQLPGAVRTVSDWLPLTNAVELVRPHVHGPVARPCRAPRAGAGGLHGRRLLGGAGAHAQALPRLKAMAATPLIPQDLLAIMVRGVSVIVASRDLALRPSVMRAVGSQVAPDGSSITVFVSRRQSRQLVQDVAATGHVAAVFSEPATHRTVQVKATRAILRNADASDAPVLARYLASMEHEIQRVGIAPPMTRAMLAHQLDDLVAISFEPEQAFDQTPGPKAGAPLSGGGSA